MSERLLDGAGILVTRPRQQVDELVDAIESRGGVAISFPVIDILPRNAAEVRAEVADLKDPAITIFISRNAVDHGLPYAAGQLAAIGPTTADAIRSAGAQVDICPDSGFDSEHLLAEPVFEDVAGKTIRIIRGDSGRELLASTLRERGAQVDYVSTYVRTMPEHSAADLASLEQRWRAGEVSAVIVMSIHSLQNLNSLLPDWCREQMILTPLVTPAARVLKEALNQYPGCPAILAAGPRSDDIVNAIAAAIELSAKRQPAPGTI
jgi:uroporphyrinogen-III synthase